MTTPNTVKSKNAVDLTGDGTRAMKIISERKPSQNHTIVDENRVSQADERKNHGIKD